MFNSHPVAGVLATLAKTGSLFDSTQNAESEQSSGAAADFTMADIALNAVAALHEWAETSADDLDAGETLATRLSALFVGIADMNQNGEIDNDEAEVVNIACNAAAEYLASKGVSEDDITSLLEDFDDTAAERVQELMASQLPEGDEPAWQDMDDFVFGGDAETAVMDAVYKMKLAIKGGRKVRVKKRISGTVRLSARQKVAVSKMLRRSNSATAKMHRAKSMRVRSSMGV